MKRQRFKPSPSTSRANRRFVLDCERPEGVLDLAQYAIPKQGWSAIGGAGWDGCRQATVRKRMCS